MTKGNFLLILYKWTNLDLLYFEQNLNTLVNLFSDDTFIGGYGDNKNLLVSCPDDYLSGRPHSPSHDRRWKSDKYSLSDFVFIKVLGKGSFGKVSTMI